MPFNPGDQVTINVPISPQGTSTREGIILAEVSTGVYRVDVGGYSLLIPEGDINAQAQQSGQGDAGVQEGVVALREQVRPEGDQPEASQGDSPVGSPQGRRKGRQAKARAQKPRKAPKRKSHVKKGKRK